MNIFEKAHITLQPFLEMTGYEPKTTFWSDFTIAEWCGGKSAIKDTYKRAFEEWKTNHVYLTELVMILNWKIWYHYENGDEDIARLYDELWRKTDEWALQNLKDEEKRYYVRTLD